MSPVVQDSFTTLDCLFSVSYSTLPNTAQLYQNAFEDFNSSCLHCADAQLPRLQVMGARDDMLHPSSIRWLNEPFKGTTGVIYVRRLESGAILNYPQSYASVSILPVNETSHLMYPAFAKLQCALAGPTTASLLETPSCTALR
ncbi:hypothetical protein P4O66_014343 [Electrophorus voltai]|uniref:Uncharacterized protein n=1 Tax=Electrophorus voltai TaxID=2609070 RepID=A0AAD8Z0S8_9TELE|nr:hypothetical protein P4O66_014343 [Electrophorus voltai]